MAARTATSTTTACACTTAPAECQWCGAPGRLHEVPRADVERRLPTVGEEDEGTCWLHYTDGSQGPFPSAQDAWDYWPGEGHRQAASPSQHKPSQAAIRWRG
jgi:hypothetical protein